MKNFLKQLIFKCFEKIKNKRNKEKIKKSKIGKKSQKLGIIGLDGK